MQTHNMKDTLFQIRNLVCAYNRGKPVLKIDELDIPQGELVFLLGVSGAGKSTLIETLALMNSTLESGGIHFETGKSGHLEYSQLWAKNNAAEIADIRKEHFSFIFQDTNLMENFTAYENICLSKMIKQDVSQETVMPDAKALAEKVGLPENELNAETLAAHLSGGQRQRLAFIRAINNDFSVIFGDEPTGNLDEENANELLHILKQHLSEKSAAILVSHDIDLAVRHADRIIVITESAQGYGQILPENVFTKALWAEHPETFRKRLSDLYKKTVPPHTTNPATAPETTSNNETYASLFFKKEGRALAGKQRINFWILTAIIALTFLVIGFANGSLNYLDKKMNNAFVKWMDVSIPWRESANAENIKNTLKQPALSKEFNYENVSAYVKYPLRFWDINDRMTRAKGRSVYLENNSNPLLTELLEDKNRLYGDAQFEDNMDMSLIVTKRFLDNLGLPENTAFVDMAFSVIDEEVSDNTYLKIPIPVRAVVKEIPGRNLFVYTLNFYETVKKKYDSTFDIRDVKNIQLMVPGSRKNAETILAEIDQFFKAHPEYDDKEPQYEILGEHRMSYVDGHDIEISFWEKAEGCWDNIQKAGTLEKVKNTRRVYPYESEHLSGDAAFDRISLYFNDLAKVRPFADTLYYNHQRLNVSDPIEMDIAQIKEKENFNFLSKITKIVAWLLVGFGAITVSLFIFNLLKMHLSKVKTNIGTLKAFGLSNDKAQNIYFRIIISFLFCSLIVGLITALLLGYGIDLFLSGKIVQEAGASYFTLWHSNTFITLIILILVALFVSRFTIRSILSKSPGDLIYGR